MGQVGMESLAELLGELKERSGLSFGVLAKQLHLSASTLHRYCNGEAVPTEFAVVERLARICGATPQELVEVHRRWVLADEYRGRRAEAAAAPSSDAEDALRPARPPRPANGPHPAGSSVQEPDTETLSGPGSAPPPARRRRTLVLAAAVAVVVAVGSLALALNSGRDDGADDGKSRRIAGPTAPPDLSPTPSDLPGKSADKDEPHGKGTSHEAEPPEGPEGENSPRDEGKSPGVDVKGAPSGPASRTGSPPLGSSRGDGKGPASGDPEGEAPGAALTARTRPYAFEYEDDCVESFLVDRAPDKVPARPAWQDVPAWVGELGAVSAREQFVEVTVQGTGGEPVVVTGMNVRVRSTGAPLAWNNFRIGNGCGEVVETKYFSVDLDAAAPRLTPRADQDDFPYKVSESDPLVFYVTGRAEKYDVRWYLEVEWSQGDRHGTLRIDDQGKPFRTSGVNGRPTYEWGGADEWLRVGGRNAW
ncbi:helix-turn-helix domain-containing protein [Streptomyces alboflavus]|uniref:helix-turn-helix domain-containing protein n=1 Tax=Streptomyces alboflavus TaxID=67267 RepID=UPI00369AA235